jgi:hypothetical protein
VRRGSIIRFIKTEIAKLEVLQLRKIDIQILCASLALLIASVVTVGNHRSWGVITKVDTQRVLDPYDIRDTAVQGTVTDRLVLGY